MVRVFSARCLTGTTSIGIKIPLVGDLLMIAKGNVKIGIEWRFGADWPGHRCVIKHLHSRKIKVQVTAVARPRNQYFQIITVN